MENLMLHIQHISNPLHVYCRLMNMGLEKQLALLLIRNYEILVYKRIIRFTYHFISYHRSQ
jgi:hypothetical protein